MHMMIFGAGYSGQAIGQLAAENGFEVTGTTRSEEKLASLAAVGIAPQVFDGEAISTALAARLSTATHLIQSIAPGNAGDPLIRLTDAEGLKRHMPQLKWVCYLSTVGVYGDHQGGWVDETSELRPVSRRSMERVEAEQAWTLACAREDLPLAILRLSGIYGPGRNTFMNFAKGTARRLVKKDQVFNRIRVEDIAGAALFLAQARTAGIFNVTDDEPCPPQDVVTEAARIMGVEPPPEQPFETADLTPMARSFYGENKRVSNAKIRSLGYTFHYPEYRTSLLQLWETRNSKITAE